MNGLSEEGLRRTDFAQNQIATRALSAAALAANPAFAAFHQATPDLAENVLAYLARCALPSTAALSYETAPGITATYAGSLGLAPEWATRALRVEEQEAVSGCLMAHVNAVQHHVAISVRGAENALVSLTTESELAQFPRHEGSFYGNLFSATAQLHVCGAERTEFEQFFGPAGRICAESDACGFVFDGACEDVCTTVTERAVDGTGEYAVSARCNGFATPITTYLQY